MLVGGFTFGLIVGALGEMARKANPGDNFRKKKIAQVSAYLARRGVTADLLRRVRLYFQNHYETVSVFSTEEYDDYFSKLPTDIRLELAREVGYMDSAKRPGLLSKVPSFGGLDSMSLILVCTKLKTELYPKSVFVMTSEDENGLPIMRETICRQGEHAWETIVFMEGVANVTSADGAELNRFLHHTDAESLNHGQDGTPADRTSLKACDYLDEHVALLPPHSVIYRTHTVYATTDVTVALLAAEDVSDLRKVPAIDRHLRPYAASAKRGETIKLIQKVFAAIDGDQSQNIDKSEFLRVMNMMGSQLDENKVNLVFDAIDVDANGEIDVLEFTEWWLEQERTDTSIRNDGAVTTNTEDFDLQSLKRDMADLDKMTTGMQVQLARISDLLKV